MGAAFDRRQHPVKNAEVGVAGTGVIEPAGVAMGKGAGGKDRRHHRSGVSRKAVSVVDHPGVQPKLVRVGSGIGHRGNNS